MRPENDPHPARCEAPSCASPPLYKLTFWPDDDAYYACEEHRHFPHWTHARDSRGYGPGQVVVETPLERPSLWRKLDYALIFHIVLLALTSLAAGATWGLGGLVVLLVGVANFFAGWVHGRSEGA